MLTFGSFNVAAPTRGIMNEHFKGPDHLFLKTEGAICAILGVLQITPPNTKLQLQRRTQACMGCRPPPPLPAVAVPQTVPLRLVVNGFVSIALPSAACCPSQVKGVPRQGAGGYTSPLHTGARAFQYRRCISSEERPTLLFIEVGFQMQFTQLHA